MFLYFLLFGDSHLYAVNYVQWYISVTIPPCYRSHLIHIVRTYKVMKYCYISMECCYYYSFPIFQDRSYRHDTFSHYDLIFMSYFLIMSWFLWSALMTIRLCWLSREPNSVAHFYTNLDDLIIVKTPKSVSIPASFLRLGFIGGLLVLLLFISMVTSCHLLHIPPVAVLVTIHFLVGLCALLGDGGVSLSTQPLHFAWAEASFEVLAVQSID